MRVLVDELLYPDGQLKEADGKRASREVLNEMACVVYPCRAPGNPKNECFLVSAVSTYTLCDLARENI